MARSKGAVYSGSLKLDRIVGIRNDLGRPMTYVPTVGVKPVEQPPKAMKTEPNVTPEGFKK